MSEPPEAGFFGKLPSTGDFVARGLPQGFRTQWDLWVTRHIAPLARDGGWPEGGLRFRLVSGARVAAGVIVPGQDSAGRRFPLSLILIGADLPGPRGLDPWLTEALDAAAPAQSADALIEALDAIPAPEPGPAEPVAMVLWVAGHDALPCDPAEPEGQIRQCLRRERG